MVSKEELQKKAGKLLGHLIRSIEDYNKNETSLQQHYILVYSTFLFLSGIFISLFISRLVVRMGKVSLVFDLLIVCITIICLIFSTTYFLKSRNASSGFRALKELKVILKELKLLNKEAKELKTYI